MEYHLSQDIGPFIEGITNPEDSVAVPVPDADGARARAAEGLEAGSAPSASGVSSVESTGDGHEATEGSKSEGTDSRTTTPSPTPPLQPVVSQDGGDEGSKSPTGVEHGSAPSASGVSSVESTGDGHEATEGSKSEGTDSRTTTPSPTSPLQPVVSQDGGDSPTGVGQESLPSSAEPASIDHKITTLSTVLQDSGLSKSFALFSSEKEVNDVIFDRSVPTASRIMLKFLWDSVESNWFDRLTSRLSKCFTEIEYVFGDFEGKSAATLSERFAVLYKLLQDVDEDVLVHFFWKLTGVKR